MERITRKTLQTLLDRVNDANNTNFELDEAHCYGGYCLTTNNGSKHINSRCSNKEMYYYLHGMLDIINNKEDREVKLTAVARETLDYAARICNHPDVVKQPFALNSSNIGRALNEILADSL